MTLPVVVVAGPTASGKSALALSLAERFDGVVINADSMQLYLDLDILTDRPGSEALARAPHVLYGVVTAAQRCSAGQWRAMACAEIERARQKRRVAIVTGGTGLYLRALTVGLADIPEIPPAIRRANPDAIDGIDIGARPAKPLTDFLDGIELTVVGTSKS